jgi:hypothetical protein
MMELKPSLMVVVAPAMAGRTTKASKTSRLGNVRNSQLGGIVMCVGRLTE